MTELTVAMIAIDPETRVELLRGLEFDTRGGMLPMAEEGKVETRPLMQAFAPLHRRAMGTAMGIALGSTIFVVTLASLGRDAHPAEHLGLLSQFLVGYSVSLPGALIGLVWGFATGYILGWSFALLRNLAVWIYLVRLRMHTDMEQYGDFIDHL